jgi:hypothetical protein
MNRSHPEVTEFLDSNEQPDAKTELASISDDSGAVAVESAAGVCSASVSFCLDLLWWCLIMSTVATTRHPAAAIRSTVVAVDDPSLGS